MTDRPTRISIIIPALNEADAIGHVLDAIPRAGTLPVAERTFPHGSPAAPSLRVRPVPPAMAEFSVTEIIVIDNGSTDATAEVATAHGARVIHEPRRGYGQACLTGIADLDAPDVVVFLDADHSDYPEDLPDLVAPIAAGEADLVIGSRVRGEVEAGAFTPQQRYGNWLACTLIACVWGERFTDLGPFRAIGYAALKQLEMDDRDFGWTVQMQARAAARGLRCIEKPARYRKRIGVSKISGTVKGVFKAGTKILYTVAAEAVRPTPPRRARQRIIVFTRQPEPGNTKTRLIPALGPDAAAALQTEMTRHVLGWAMTAARPGRAGPVTREVDGRYHGGDAATMAELFGHGPEWREQATGDLGAKMAGAFGEAFAEGCDAAIAVGADCPTVTADVMEQAFEMLASHDVVLGPATDGGYYLIGCRRVHAEIFQNMRWGIDTVLAETLRRADAAGLHVGLLSERSDVDRPVDLGVWERARRAPPPAQPARISVIIPTLDEAAHLPATLARVRAAPGVELIVVDGGSADATRTIAADAGATVLTAPPSRGGQQHVGAQHAGGNVLLFLHADTLLPADYADQIAWALADPTVACGAFSFDVEAAAPLAPLLRASVRARSRLLGMPYGDQALFMRRAAYDAVGGFADRSAMEDFDLVRRLHRVGRVITLDAPATTSARSWRAHGLARTTLIHQMRIARYAVREAFDI